MALASRQLEAPTVVAAAYGQAVAAAVAVIASLSEQLVVLEVALTQAFSAHREAGIVQSQPGLGQCSERGCWPSSATTPTAAPVPRPARPTPAPPRAPERRAWDS